MDAPARLHKMTAFSQILEELKTKIEDIQTKIIKTASEDDMRHMLLRRYPLKLTQLPETTPALVQEMERLLPEAKQIIERVLAV